MKKQIIQIPQGTLTVEDMEKLAGMLFRCGYAVQRKSEKTNNKSNRAIEFWREIEDA